MVVSVREWYVATPTQIQYGVVSTPTSPIVRPTVTPPPVKVPEAQSFVDFTKSPWFFLTVWGVLLVLSVLAVWTKIEENNIEKQGIKQGVQVLWMKQQEVKHT